MIPSYPSLHISRSFQQSPLPYDLQSLCINIQQLFFYTARFFSDAIRFSFYSIFTILVSYTNERSTSIPILQDLLNFQIGKGFSHRIYFCSLDPIFNGDKVLSSSIFSISSLDMINQVKDFVCSFYLYYLMMKFLSIQSVFLVPSRALSSQHTHRLSSSMDT